MQPMKTIRNHHTDSLKLSRRSFLTLTATGIALPTWIPSASLGLNGVVAPSNRIKLSGIGIRNRGTYVLGFMLQQPDVQFRAVCDVQSDRRAAVKKIADEKYGNTDCQVYRDFRELLQRDDIDAVLIATGDRWHTLASVLAAQAGKDVYSEKPCCITMEQCRILDEAIKRSGVVFQAGTQRRSVDNFRFAIDLARSGKLGKIHTVHASIYHLSVLYDWLPAEPVPNKEIIDWDLWLGPAPWRPFNRKYVGGGNAYAQWRGHYDLDSGARLHDWGAHTVDLCQWAVTDDNTAPVEYEANGGTVYATYANGIKLVMRPEGWMGLGDCPVRFEGEEGWVETGDSGKIAVFPESLKAEMRPSANIGGISPAAHVRDFFNCVKTRSLPACGSTSTRYSHLACHAAALSWMLKRKLRFDPVKEEFIGDDEANRMRSRTTREPWSFSDV
jgi:predicted dehydrogenase